jgi:hypothetical protein
MTEQQLMAIKVFGNLPIYDEDEFDRLDPTQAHDPRYEGTLREVEAEGTDSGLFLRPSRRNLRDYRLGRADAGPIQPDLKRSSSACTSTAAS